MASESEDKSCLVQLSEEELAVFKRFREKVDEAVNNEPFCDDRCLLRYLRARQWNIDNSWTMLKNTLDWRKEFKPEAITLEEINEEALTGKMYISPHKDKEGRPIVVMRPGLDTTKNRVAKVKYLVWIVENSIKRTNPEEDNIEKISILVDFTGTGMALAGIDNTKVSIEVLNILQNHYPERLGKAIMVSPPWIFSAFWKVIKPLLDPVTQDKILFAKDKKKDCAVVMDHIAEEHLEKDFGGSSEWTFDHSVWLAEVRRENENLQ